MAAKKDNDNVLIKWSGSAGIESATALHKELLKALKNNSNVLLDITDLEDIDITGIQLILSAKKEADAQNKNFSLTGSIPQHIADFVDGCGISFNSFFSDGSKESK